jgi:hypothetical protein
VKISKHFVRAIRKLAKMEDFSLKGFTLMELFAMGLYERKRKSRKKKGIR